MILMQAPGPNLTFGGMPSGSTYVSSQYSLIYITNSSVADQTALAAAGCYTLSPFGGWGTYGFPTLAALYATDSVTNLFAVGQVGFPEYTMAVVYADPVAANNGTWSKTATGAGTGNWSYINAIPSSGAIAAAASAAIAVAQALVAQAASGAATSAATTAQSAMAAVLTAVAMGTLQSFPSTAAALATGVVGLAVTANGSGGTNGTNFTGTFTGGGGSGAQFQFAVTSGAVVPSSIVLTSKGSGYTSTPTPVFTASSGLTGVTATVTTGANTVSGQYFSVINTTTGAIDVYLNSAGAAVYQFSLFTGLSAIPPESGWSYAVLDSLRHFLFGANTAGVFSANKQNQPLGTFQINGVAIENAIFQPTYPESGFLVVVVDSLKKLVWGITTQFAVVTPNGSVNQVTSPLADATYMVDTIIDGSGNSQIRSHSRADGTRRQLTTTGNNLNPTLDPAGNVLFQRYPVGGSAFVPYWSPANGSKPIAPILPTGIIDCYGDSITAGNGSGTPWVTQLAAATNRTVNNFGIPGQITTQVAARQGALPVTLTAGATIPTSGGVTLSLNVLLMSTLADASTRNMTGTLGGVHGTLTRTASDTSGNTEVYTFVRDTTGSTVTLLTGARFYPDQAAANAGDVQIFFAATNDLLYQGSMTSAQVTAQILANYEAAAQYQTSYIGGRLWVSMMNRSTEPAGSANFTTVMNTNAALAAAAPAYGAKFLDARSYMCVGINGNTTTQAMFDLGLTPTAQDLIDIGNNVIPTQLRATGDIIHPDQAGNTAYCNFFLANGLVATGF